MPGSARSGRGAPIRSRHAAISGAIRSQYYRHRVKLCRELWASMEKELETPGDGYRSAAQLPARPRSGCTRCWTAARYVGGVYHYRDHVGDPGKVLPFVPVPADQQRKALNLIRDNLFAPRCVQVSPQMLNKLTTERFPDFATSRRSSSGPDYPIHQQILSLQTAGLNRMFHPVIMSRVIDNELRVDKRCRRR